MTLKIPNKSAVKQFLKQFNGLVIIQFTLFILCDSVN